MNRPRRTAELAEPPASSSKPRVSRIAQSTRRPSTRPDRPSMERSNSVDRLSSANNYLQVPSSTKRQRCSSVNRAGGSTKTPLRSPATKSVPSTSEKQRAPVTDKRWVQDNVQRILDYLRDVDIGLAKEFFNRGGLKAMSTKDFVAIVNHFLKSIVGNRPSIGKDYVEDIVKILEQIEYPFSVAKSWLKTPSAPHALSNVVLLLSWLLQFKVTTTQIATFESKNIELSEEFVDMECQLRLLEVPKEAFDLWNNKFDNEYESLKTATMGELIFKKTGLAGLEAVDEETQRLHQKLATLTSERIVIKDEDKYKQLDKELSAKRKQIDVLGKKCDDLQGQIEDLHSAAEIKWKIANDIQQRIFDIKEIIRTQKASISERDVLIEEDCQLRHELATKKSAISNLQQMGHNNQIVLTRLMKQRTELISKFNNYINELVTEVDQLSAESLYLDANCETDLLTQITNIGPILHETKNCNSNYDSQYCKKIEDNEKQIKMMSYELEQILEPRLLESNKTRKDLHSQVDKKDLDVLSLKNEAAKELENLAGKVRTVCEVNAQLNVAMDAKVVEVAAAKDKNEYMMSRLSDKMDEVFAYREKRVKLLGDALDGLNQKIEEFKANWGDKELVLPQ